MSLLGITFEIGRRHYGGYGIAGKEMGENRTNEVQ